LNIPKGNYSRQSSDGFEGGVHRLDHSSAIAVFDGTLSVNKLDENCKFLL